MKKIALLIVGAFMLLSIGCQTVLTKEDMMTPVPQESPMAQIKVGMPPGEVEHILGKPDDVYNFQQLTICIPFYYFLADDFDVMVYYYKNLGVIEFIGEKQQRVRYYKYNPNEPGYSPYKSKVYNKLT